MDIGGLSSGRETNGAVTRAIAALVRCASYSFHVAADSYWWSIGGPGVTTTLSSVHFDTNTFKLFPFVTSVPGGYV